MLFSVVYVESIVTQGVSECNGPTFPMYALNLNKRKCYTIIYRSEHYSKVVIEIRSGNEIVLLRQNIVKEDADKLLNVINSIFNRYQCCIINNSRYFEMRY